MHPSILKLLALWAVLLSGCSSPGNGNEQPAATATDSTVAVPVQFDWQRRIGVAAIYQEACLRIGDAGLSSGTNLLLLSTDSTVESGSARVQARDDSCRGDAPDSESTAYSLVADSIEFGIYFAIPAASAPAASRSLDLDQHGTAESFRMCNSTEGLHLTVWSGPPLTGQLRWHRYHYVGYDMEPNCTDRDYPADTSKFTRALHQAVRELVRIPIEAFDIVPAQVRAEFSALGCRVPQSFHNQRPHNVIKGRFASPNQQDWAALCARGDSSVIAVAWGGPARCPAPIALSEDRGWFQGIDQDRVGYSRAIGTATMEFILEMARAFNKPLPPAQDHDGINEAFVEKASKVHFCHNGRWYLLQGMD
ncbi:MAG: hypothetical protein WEE89_12300 [Gemmatimonadota bacterium]